MMLRVSIATSITRVDGRGVIVRVSTIVPKNPYD